MILAIVGPTGLLTNIKQMQAEQNWTTHTFCGIGSYKNMLQ